MKRWLCIIAYTTFYACGAKETGKNVATISNQSTITHVDSVHFKKFVPPIEFHQFSVDAFNGKRAGIQYASNKTAQQFRTAINSSIDKFGMNFAGHYNLARWGCGTSCINGAITDLITGKVYNLPPATLDYAFQNNSRLLVVNPPDSLGYYNYCSYCEPELWVWNEKDKMFEKLN